MNYTATGNWIGVTTSTVRTDVYSVPAVCQTETPDENTNTNKEPVKTNLRNWINSMHDLINLFHIMYITFINIKLNDEIHPMINFCILVFLFESVLIDNYDR